MRQEHPNAAIVIVSDHGFAPVTKQFNIDAAMVKAGLIKLKKPGATVRDAGIADWTALSWTTGGSAAISMKNRDDPAARAKVKAALDAMAADPNNGIASVLDRDEIAKLGGAPSADFWVDMKPPYSTGRSLGGPLVVDTRPTGGHGHSPTHPELNAFFLIAGDGIAQRGDIGDIDMRAVAPTLAAVMHVSLPGADAAALPIATMSR
jgi:predicted AlkP superfamily phosphohydrolase/phosphomutase